MAGDWQGPPSGAKGNSGVLAFLCIPEERGRQELHEFNIVQQAVRELFHFQKVEITRVYVVVY